MDNASLLRTLKLEDLQPLRKSNSPIESLLYLEIIQHASFEYLYFAVTKYKITPEDFYEAFNYFFKSRSDKPATWFTARFRRETETDSSGKKTTRVVRFTEQDMKCMCFDKHYIYSGLERIMSMDVFLERLMQQRRKILTENIRDVEQFVRRRFKEESLDVRKGSQLPLTPFSRDLVSVLTKPMRPIELAELLYLPESMKRKNDKVTFNGRNSSSSSINNRRRAVASSSD